MKVLKTLKIGTVKVAEQIFSDKLGCEIWIVEDQSIYDFVRDGVVKYSQAELGKLKGVTLESLRSIHRTKEVFSLPTVVSQKKGQTK